jgi:hypothetical protein
MLPGPGQVVACPPLATPTWFEYCAALSAGLARNLDESRDAAPRELIVERQAQPDCVRCWHLDHSAGTARTARSHLSDSEKTIQHVQQGWLSFGGRFQIRRRHRAQGSCVAPISSTGPARAEKLYYSIGQAIDMDRYRSQADDRLVLQRSREGVGRSLRQWIAKLHAYREQETGQRAVRRLLDRL